MVSSNTRLGVSTYGEAIDVPLQAVHDRRSNGLWVRLALSDTRRDFDAFLQLCPLRR